MEIPKGAEVVTPRFPDLLDFSVQCKASSFNDCRLTGSIVLTSQIQSLLLTQRTVMIPATKETTHEREKKRVEYKFKILSFFSDQEKSTEA